MEIQDWDERYRSGERRAEDLDAAPTPLLVETAKKLVSGSALDLACGELHTPPEQLPPNGHCRCPKLKKVKMLVEIRKS